MADKTVTVAVPEERVPEFYLWFAHFLASPAGSQPGPGGGAWSRRGGPGGFGRRGPGGDGDPWTPEDAETAAWLRGRLAGPAGELFDLLAREPGRRWPGNALAEELGLQKGAHGVAGILAWPGRYCRKLGKALPIATARRDDGGTDYWMDEATAALFRPGRPAGPPAGAGDAPDA
jgi:hypothetical protein